MSRLLQSTTIGSTIGQLNNVKNLAVPHLFDSHKSSLLGLLPALLIRHHLDNHCREETRQRSEALWRRNRGEVSLMETCLKHSQCCIHRTVFGAVSSSRSHSHTAPSNNTLSPSAAINNRNISMTTSTSQLNHFLPGGERPTKEPSCSRGLDKQVKRQKPQRGQRKSQQSLARTSHRKLTWGLGLCCVQICNAPGPGQVIVCTVIVLRLPDDDLKHVHV